MRLVMDGRITRRRREWLQGLGRLGETLIMPVHLVGGPVRDLIMGRSELDTDISVEGDALEFARLLAHRDTAQVVTHPEFQSATVTYADGKHLDVVATRSETYSQPGALPCVSRADIIEDLKRRDFTIYAIAMDLRPRTFGQLLDPYEGYRHLRQGLLQGLHEATFTDDPTRILRAARFTVRLGLRVDGATAQWLEAAVADNAPATVSRQRIVTELRYLLAEPTARWTLALLGRWGALEHLGLAGAHNRLVLADELLRAQADLGIRADASMLTAATLGLLLEPGEMEQWLAGWPLTAEEQKAARQAALLAHQPPDVVFSTTSESSKLYAGLRGSVGAALLAGWAAGNANVRSNLKRYHRELADVEADVTGDDLVARGYRPGPSFKAALEAALKAKLDDGADREEQMTAAAHVLDS